MREIWSSTGDPEDCAEDSYMPSVRISVTVLSSGEFRFLARETQESKQKACIVEHLTSGAASFRKEAVSPRLTKNGKDTRWGSPHATGTMESERCKLPVNFIEELFPRSRRLAD